MNKSRIWFSLQVYNGGWQELETFKKTQGRNADLKGNAGR